MLIGLAFPWIPDQVRLPILVFAAFTDLLDGALSRRFHATSDIGKLLDPIADKILVASLLFTLLWEGKLGWLALLGVGCRDIVVMILTAWGLARRNASRWREFAPSMLGKATTCAQFAFLVGCLAMPDVPIWLLLLTVALSTLAAFDYVRIYRRRASANTERPA